jgi:hypothetical protein
MAGLIADSEEFTPACTAIPSRVSALSKVRPDPGVKLDWVNVPLRLAVTWYTRSSVAVGDILPGVTDVPDPALPMPTPSAAVTLAIWVLTH